MVNGKKRTVHRLTLSFRDRILKSYQLQQGQTLIGRSNDCDITIDNLGISMTHARIERDGGRVTITDISDNGGMLVNGTAVRESELNPGDRITLGKFTLAYAQLEEEIEDDAAAITPIGQPVTNGWLQFMNGPKLGRTLKLDRALIKLGKRGSHSAMISGRSDGYYISHLEGDTPTRVGSRDIGQESYKLNDGDTIQIGDIKMLFFIDGKQE